MASPPLTDTSDHQRRTDGYEETVGNAAVSHRELTTVLTTMTTVGLPSTYTTTELVSCLVAPSACAYGSDVRFHPLSNGIVTTRDVPLPAMLEICTFPPRASMRSVRPMSPEPFVRSAPPIPSSRIKRCRFASSAAALIFTSDACAWLAVFGRALAPTEK